jgi:hypothetical protein
MEPTQGVLTQVCLQCGKEYFYDRVEPPTEQVCDRCGNRVFRSFFSPTTNDEVEQEIRDATERDLTTEDPGTDVAPGDLVDLNNP